MSIISIKNLIYEYFRRDDEDQVTEIVQAVAGVSFNVEEGEFVAILGTNGSGKSTLAKHLNGLLKPTEGTVIIDGKNTADDQSIWEVRKNAGMVFQNPDNQIIGTLVEEDVAFGPENLGLSTENIWNRVLDSLESVGMTSYRTYSPNKLSGGQKQRVAIAGILAMEPKCIILDEATAMLDPEGRKSILETISKLNQEKKITIILITHHMDEVLFADKVYVMDKGKAVMSGTPRQIFANPQKLWNMGLDVPEVTKIAKILENGGLNIGSEVLSNEELVNKLSKCIKDTRDYENLRKEKQMYIKESTRKEVNPKQAIILSNVGYTYEQGTINENVALQDITISIGKGEFVGVVGHTGSGKSTLMQTLNGLIKPSSGTIYFNGEDIYEKDYDISQLREKVGLVFQYPEHQLFAETVFTDVCFGPSNLNLSQLECQKRAFDAIAAVGLDENCYDLSPFQLSGGQKRRVAIAGVLAMEPDYLILDEPAAGLDPRGKEEIFALLNKLHYEKNITIVIVSHCMEDVAEYAERVIVLNEGHIAYDDTTDKVFSHVEELEDMGLGVPEITNIMKDLYDARIAVRTDIYRRNQGIEEILLSMVQVV